MWELFDGIPRSVESAIEDLASAANTEAVESLIAHVSCGEVVSVSLFDVAGTQHFIRKIDGDWYEMVSVDG